MILLASLVILLGGEARLSQAANSEIYSVYLPVVYKNYIKGFTNSGFENGTESWTVQSNQGDSVVTDSAAHSGQRSAGLGNGNSNRLTSITQQVSYPGRQAVTVPYIWTSTDTAMLAGRELYGMPKMMCDHDTLHKNANEIVGRLHRKCLAACS